MSAESLGARARVGHWRVTFRHWRWQRPFWSGLLTLLAGIPIVYIPYADPSLEELSFRLATTTGSGSLIIGVLLVVLGLTQWFQPHGRVFAGVAAILLALVSLVVSNFGGYLIGFLLALIGGALGTAWAPGTPGGGPAPVSARAGLGAGTRPLPGSFEGPGPVTRFGPGSADETAGPGGAGSEGTAPDAEPGYAGPRTSGGRPTEPAGTADGEPGRVGGGSRAG